MNIGLPELLIFLVVLVVVLGPKRIPRSARALGVGVRNFKSSIKGDEPPETLPPRTTSTEPETVDGEVVGDSTRR
jgi:sec-independent protein translocase protein TatA